MAKEKAQKKLRRRPTKGALIKGISQQLPRELLFEPTFREELRGLMRGYSGLYVLYRRNSLYYIGLAKDLFWRLHTHTKDKHNKCWDRFAIYRIARIRYLKDIESLLLRVANPPGNAVTGNFHRDADVTKVLRKIQQQQTRTLNKIKKVLK